MCLKKDLKDELRVTVDGVNSVSRIEAVVRGLTGSQVSDVRHFNFVAEVRPGREEKFELVEVSVSEKLTDDRVSESVDESVVFSGPTIWKLNNLSYLGEEPWSSS